MHIPTSTLVKAWIQSTARWTYPKAPEQCHWAFDCRQLCLEALGLQQSLWVQALDLQMLVAIAIKDRQLLRSKKGLPPQM